MISLYRDNVLWTFVIVLSFFAIVLSVSCWCINLIVSVRAIHVPFYYYYFCLSALCLCLICEI